MNATLESYVARRIAEFDAVDEERRRPLLELARFVRERRAAGDRARLLFVCTHNSRRSHLAQIWARTAAFHYGLRDVDAFSGGVEITAFDPRAVAALTRAGFRIAAVTAVTNPVYEVRYSAGPGLRACSKTVDQAPNPTRDFCAVMTCAQADAACPVLPGAAQRIALPYDDPKEFDGTDGETAAYDRCCRKIGREMLYALARAAGDSPAER